jgi:hypothetical protein
MADIDLSLAADGSLTVGFTTAAGASTGTSAAGVLSAGVPVVLATGFGGGLPLAFKDEEAIPLTGGVVRSGSLVVDSGDNESLGAGTGGATVAAAGVYGQQEIWPRAPTRTWVACRSRFLRDSVDMVGVGEEEAYGDTAKSAVAVPIRASVTGQTDIDVLTKVLDPDTPATAVLRTVGPGEHGSYSVVTQRARVIPESGYEGPARSPYTIRKGVKDSSSRLILAMKPVEPPPPPPPPTGEMFRNPRMTKSDGTPKQIIDIGGAGDWTSAVREFKAGRYTSANQVIKLGGTRLTGGVLIDFGGTEQHPLVIYDDAPIDRADFTNRGGWHGEGTIAAQWVWLWQLRLSSTPKNLTQLRASDWPDTVCHLKRDNAFVTACEIDSQQGVHTSAGADCANFVRLGFNKCTGNSVWTGTGGNSALGHQFMFYQEFSRFNVKQPDNWHVYRNWFTHTLANPGPQDGDHYAAHPGPPTGDLGATYNYKTHQWLSPVNQDLNQFGSICEYNWFEKGRQGKLYMKHPPKIIRFNHFKEGSQPFLRGGYPHHVQVIGNRWDGAQGSFINVEGSELLFLGNVSSKPFNLAVTSKNSGNPPKPRRGADGTRLIGNNATFILGNVVQPEYSNTFDLRDISFEAHTGSILSAGSIDNPGGPAINFTSAGVGTGSNPNLVTNTVTKRPSASMVVPDAPILNSTNTGPRALGRTWGT